MRRPTKTSPRSGSPRRRARKRASGSACWRRSLLRAIRATRVRASAASRIFCASSSFRRARASQSWRSRRPWFARLTIHRRPAARRQARRRRFRSSCTRYPARRSIQASAYALGLSARVVEAEVFAPSRRRRPRAAPRRAGAARRRATGDAAARRPFRVRRNHRSRAGARRLVPPAGDDLHSFDMLGEGARTAHDAQTHFDAYDRRHRRDRQGGEGATPAQRPGISVKLSALHPRYEAISTDRVADRTDAPPAASWRNSPGRRTSA